MMRMGITGRMVYDDDESSGLPQMVMRDVDIFLDSQEQFHPR